MLPWLSLQQPPRQPRLWLSSRTPGTSLPRGVCGVTGVPRARSPHPALPGGVHGRALLTVEHLGEGFEVLQRAHHPKHKEKGLIYVEMAVLGNRKWFGASELDCSSEYGML